MKFSSFSRAGDIVLCIAMVGAAAFTYVTKHEAENRLADIRELERKIVFERDTIDVLEADWALLTQPNRIQALVERFDAQLQLENVEAHQVASVRELPMRPLRIEDIMETMVDAAPAAPDASITTGGINQ